MNILKMARVLATKLIRANRKAGLRIVNIFGRGLKKVSPGLHRTLLGPLMRNPAMAVRLRNIVSQGLIPVLVGSVGLWAYLRSRRSDDELDLSDVDGSMASLAQYAESTSQNITGLAEQLRGYFARIESATSNSTDFDVFQVCVMANDTYLKYLMSIKDPKVAEFASRHLLETTTLVRQGLVYEKMGATTFSDLFTSYENDPTPSSEEEVIIALEALGRTNSRLIMDTYE